MSHGRPTSHMPHLHGHNIVPDLSLSQEEGKKHLVCDVLWSIINPIDIAWLWMLHRLEPQLVHQVLWCHVHVATSIYDHVDAATASLNIGPEVKFINSSERHQPSSPQCLCMPPSSTSSFLILGSSSMSSSHIVDPIKMRQHLQK